MTKPMEIWVTGRVMLPGNVFCTIGDIYTTPDQYAARLADWMLGWAVCYGEGVQFQVTGLSVWINGVCTNRQKFAHNNVVYMRARHHVEVLP